ncbi:MAG: DUF4390 domain-containing protein [Gammaproteobacteria bacterium]|nr:DUF4390 domain-containing protein [Gammaproteobacteria bacterium]
MNVTSTTRFSGFYRLLTGLMLALLLGQAVAADTGLRFREFSIHAGNSPQSLLSSLKLDYQLTPYLREGLLNGMTLENEINFELEWHNTWWWNTRKRLYSVKAELKYHTLSKQYQVFRTGTKESWSYPNLVSALNRMGTLVDEPLPNLPPAAYNNDASIFVSAKLTPKTLYLPLKIQALFSDRYSLEAEGVMWPIP